MGRKAKYDWSRLASANEGEWVNYGKGDRNSMQQCARFWVKQNGIDVAVCSMYEKKKNVLIATFAW